MIKYGDRPWYEFPIPKALWYEKRYEEMYHYYQAQKAIAERRLSLLTAFGVEYRADVDNYIRVSDGSTFRT